MGEIKFFSEEKASRSGKGELFPIGTDCGEGGRQRGKSFNGMHTIFCTKSKNNFRGVRTGEKGSR